MDIRAVLAAMLVVCLARCQHGSRKERRLGSNGSAGTQRGSEGVDMVWEESQGQDLGQDRLELLGPAQPTLLAKQGSSLTLSCRPSRPWFLCLWVRPGGAKHCAIQEAGRAREVCRAGPRGQLRAGRGRCQLHLTNITVAEAGEFLCVVSQAGGGFTTARRRTALTVASPALTSLRLASQPGRPLPPRASLALQPGEEMEVSCGAEGGVPAPQFSWWLEGGNSSVELSKSSRPGESGLASVLRYTARPAHSGLTLVCRVWQQHGGEKLYSSQHRLALTVPAPALPLHALLAAQQDLLAGVLLSCLLLILAATSVVVFTVRRGRPVPAKEHLETSAGSDYVIFMEESMESGGSRRSLPDISHGEFVSFVSSEDLYSQQTAGSPQNKTREDSREVENEEGSRLESAVDSAVDSALESKNTSRDWQDSTDESRVEMRVNSGLESQDWSGEWVDSARESSSTGSQSSTGSSGGGHSNGSLFHCPHGCFPGAPHHVETHKPTLIL